MSYWRSKCLMEGEMFWDGFESKPAGAPMSYWRDKLREQRRKESTVVPDLRWKARLKRFLLGFFSRSK